MNYGEFTITTAKQGYRNLIGLFVLSILATLGVIPLLGTLFLGEPLAVLGGLWTTCLLWGLLTVAAFHFSTTVADRGVPVPVRPSLSFALSNATVGVLLGVGSFTVTVLSLLLVGIAGESIQPFAIGFVAFLLLAWYLLVGFAAPELGEGRVLSVALRSSFHRIGRFPSRTAWFLLLSVVATLIAGLTLVTFVLFLPGGLALLAAKASVVTTESAEVETDA